MFKYEQLASLYAVLEKKGQYTLFPRSPIE